MLCWQKEWLGLYLDESSVGGVPTQNWLLLLSLGGQERVNFAPSFGSRCIGSEIGSEYGFAVSSSAVAGGFWTNNMLSHCVGSFGGAGILEMDPVHWVNGKSA